MQITLQIDNKEKIFTRIFVPAGVFKEALRLNKKLRDYNDADEETYNFMVEFVVYAFGNQFTADEIWNGIAIQDISFELYRIYQEVLSLGGLAPSVEGNEGEKK